MTASDGPRRFMTFSLCQQRYAIDIARARELISLESTPVHRPAGLPDGVEGLVNLRGQSLAVIDVRSALGMQSMHEETEELTQLLHAREEDHLNWLNELELAVSERREFRLTTDPHQCRFGRWYDALMADPATLQHLTNGHLGLLDAFAAFDLPHQRIHAIGAQVNRLIQQGDTAQSRALIERTRDRDLSKLRQLFTRCREAFHRVRQGLLVVLEGGDERFGAIVDKVDGVLNVDEESLTPAAAFATAASPGVLGVIRDPRSKAMIQWIDVAALRPAAAACAV